MKKIALTLMALILCIQQESSAMNNLRNYAGRFGQQCARLYNQGAQQAMPAWRSFISGTGQQIGSLRPQASQWLRNMQTSARNWNQQNTPSMRRAALGLGLGGAGLGATYWQRPDIFGFAKAEENDPYEVLHNIRMKLRYLPQENLTEQEFKNRILSLRSDLNILALNGQKEMTSFDRIEFMGAMNDILSALESDIRKDFNADLYKFDKDYARGVSMFLVNAMTNILLANAAMRYDQISLDQDIVIPTCGRLSCSGRR